MMYSFGSWFLLVERYNRPFVGSAVVYIGSSNHLAIIHWLQSFPNTSDFFLLHIILQVYISARMINPRSLTVRHTLRLDC